jgi:hypothetical protein
MEAAGGCGGRVEDEMRTLTRLLDPLIDRAWRVSPVKSEVYQSQELILSQSNEFSQRFSEFLRCYGDKRVGPFGIDDELGRAMSRLQDWLERTPAVARRSTTKVKIGVGLGGWTKTPWVALLDSRETTSTQRGRYIVFLVAEDLSTTYLTLNQGMTKLVNELGQSGAVAEMMKVAKAARQQLPELSSWGFTVGADIDLKSKTSAARKYEEGTIGYVELPTGNIPADEKIDDYLELLLEGYERLITDLDGNSESETDSGEQAAPYGVDDALGELFLDREDVERYLDTWRNKKNLILQGAPGVGKSFVARRLAYALIGEKDDYKVQTVQFHQSYSYEDFVQGYRPNGSQGFERKNGAFYEFRDRALQDPQGTYVFIIDEINRGNLSKIFGELMLLIEPDKRGPEWKTRLAYASDDDVDFFIPNNLFVLGMMNTADRSLSLVDYALRRRFAFIAMQPLYGSPKFRAHLTSHGVSDDVATRIINGMGELNQEIESDRTNLGPGFRIGHSFFTPMTKVSEPGAWYTRIVETEIHPLLEEYWFDAPETADQWRNKLLR